MPEGNRWRKAHDENTGVGCFMEEDIVNSNTDTIPIPMLDVERKTFPVFCPWCSSVSGVAKSDVLRTVKISPYYRACGKCTDFINEGMVFIRGGNSSLSRWLVLLCRWMCAFSRKWIFKDGRCGKHPPSIMCPGLFVLFYAKFIY